MSDKCSRCKAPILWVLTTENKPAPFNARPREDGDHILLPRLNSEGQALGGAKVAWHKNALNPRVQEAVRNGAELFISHFADCLFASEFRRDAKRKKL